MKKLFFIAWVIISGTQTAVSKGHNYTDLAQKTYERFLTNNPTASKNSQYMHYTSIGCLLSHVNLLPADLPKKYISFLRESFDLGISSKRLSGTVIDGKPNSYYNKIKLFHSKTEACIDEISWSFNLSKSKTPKTPLGYKWGQNKSFIDFFESEKTDEFSGRGIPHFFYFWDVLRYPSSNIGNGFEAERNFSFYKGKLGEVGYQGILKEDEYHPNDYDEITKILVQKYGKAKLTETKTKSIVGYLLPDSFSDSLGILDKAEMFTTDKLLIYHGVRTDGELTFRYINHYVVYLNKEFYRIHKQDNEAAADAEKDRKLSDNL